jgi:hypothetical protein
MKYALIILFSHISLLAIGQINYTTVPIDLQLVARDKVTNLGNVKIEGNVDQSSGYGSIKVEVYRNEVLLNTVDNELTYIDSKAPFVFNLSIQAELANYSFKIYGYNSSNIIYELNKTISNIVAGDAYIIQGQSNAVAAKYSGSANTNKSDFIRVYASGTSDPVELLANDSWYVANGDVNSASNGNTGQWGLKLARLLVDNLQIPVAIFNGAHSGKGISFFKAPLEYKNSQNSNYARLYYRLNKTGLKDNVRAVLWSQGESDAQTSYTSILTYKNYFRALENSWLTDFPNIEKIYIFQTKDCICNTSADGKMNVKEAQRQLAYENNEIEIMPTTSLFLNADNCHFPFINGYESFATRIHKLVLHDIYGKTYAEEIKAPMIKSAEFMAPNTLVLETDAVNLNFSSTDQTTMLTRLKQDFELRNVMNVSITDVALLGNKILFTLSGDPGPIGNISFVGYNSNIGFTITNSSNIELISFRNFPIKNLTYNGGNNPGTPIIENTFICNTTGSSASIPVNSSTANTTYAWLVKKPNGEWEAISSLNAGTVYSTYNTAILNIKKTTTLPVSGTLYRVVVNDGVSGDLTSNEATLIVDATPVSKLITAASTVCSGESKTLNYGIGSVGTIQWQYSTTSSSSDFIDIYQENGLTYTANDLQQTTWFRVANESGTCSPVYSTAVKVLVNPKPVSGYIEGGGVTVCKTTNSTVLKLNNSVGTIQWQKASEVAGLPGIFSNITSATSSTYTASTLLTTTYFRAVLSSGVCTSEITNPVVINVNPSALARTITGASPVCKGGSKTLTYGTGSVGTIQWQYSTTSGTADFVDINSQNGLTYTDNNIQQTTWIRVMNTSGVCSPVYSVAVQVVVNQLPVAGYITGGDVTVCKTSNSTVLTLNNSLGAIQWQKATTLTGTYSNISSATSSKYSASALTTTYYRAVLSSGVCNLVYSPIVQIGVNVVPVFNSISPICNGSPMSPLPTISTNGVRGSWSPAVNNTATTMYTFVPNGVCVNTTTMTITVNTIATPIGDVNQGFNMNASKTISDLVAIGSNIRWYTSIENALANTTPLELSTILVMGNTYYAMQTINSCSSTNPLAVKTYVDVNLGITDFDFKGLQFYPNPISDYFTIIYTERINTLQLFNTIGQSVFIAHPNAFQTSLNINFLPPGVYYLEVKANNNKGLLKVIKK